MGYSVVATLHDGHEYRLTEWVRFSRVAPDAAAVADPQNDLASVELYNHSNDPERRNVALRPASAHTLQVMRRLLWRGPTTGGRWGPWGGIDVEDPARGPRLLASHV